MFSCLQILEAFLWFVLITLLNVNPDGYFLDKLEPIPSALPSGLTPSKLYVFMPPNLGGFFMVRSYYPSECHAGYFDFERIEALKPEIEACGISTLSQSPMLGFHKQMDNRIKLLEEILSFRMQGVEVDNGDVYVDGHKAASGVCDEFVSVNVRLMDRLAQGYDLLPQLHINETIDHRPEGYFFSSRRQHTRFDCDWSSDVCSSDLPAVWHSFGDAAAHRGAPVPARRISGRPPRSLRGMERPHRGSPGKVFARGGDGLD